jgi:hypothetical protein
MTGKERRLSDADSFIQEVSEEVRRDRMNRLVRRYAPYAVGAVALVVAAAGADAWLKSQRAAEAQARGGALIEAAEQTDPARRADAFIVLGDAAEGGQATIAQLRAAAELVALGDDAAAARLYRQVAEDAGADQTLAAFAAYRAAVVGAAEAGPAATVAALGQLTGEDQPFRLLALEARALQHMALGDRAAARADLTAVLADPTATEDTRARADQLLLTLGAEDAG